MQELLDNAVKSKPVLHSIMIGNYDVNVKIIISDNGKGMLKKQLNALNMRLESCGREVLIPENENVSIGLVNVSSRIKHYYGQEYGLKLESDEDIGTSAIITIVSLINSQAGALIALYPQQKNCLFA